MTGTSDDDDDHDSSSAGVEDSDVDDMENHKGKNNDDVHREKKSTKEKKESKKRRRSDDRDDVGVNDVIKDSENSDGEDAVEDDDDGDDDGDAHDDDLDQKASKSKKQKKVHRLSLKKTEDFNEKLRKRGVIYIARIPPRMTPTKVKSLLGDFGEVTRIYLVEEDPTVRKRRKQNSSSGKSGGKRYVEGWIEYASKKIAKHVAQSLNNTQISNHKRNPHYGDLWNLKYLSGFKWSHLTEKVAYERRVREQKLRIEMMHARKENAAYIQQIEMGQKLDYIEERLKKNNKMKSDETNDGADKVATSKNKKKSHHKHRQNRPIHDGSDRPTKSALLNSLL